MVGVTEASLYGSQLDAALKAGIRSISRNEQLTFKQYNIKILPVDGFVYWVATGGVTTVTGSLHYSTDLHQAEDETAGVNHVIFTAESEIQEFNTISPTTIWIATFNNIEFAFSSRGLFYAPANIYHYLGIAILPALKSQIVDSSTQIPTEPIVTNSLPIWLSQNSFAPVYPSFLVSQNIEPPYIVAHIEPTETNTVQSFPLYQGWPSPPIPINPTLYNLTSQQLCADKVRLTLYGFNNQTALQYLVSLIEYSKDTDDFGFMNNPVIHDDKRTQPEIAAIAMKKTIDIIASYYQSAADVIARRLIVEAIVSATTAI